MNYKNTRRGQTQEIIYKNCHSKFNLESHHVLLSKVRSRIKYGMTPLYDNGRCVEDAEQRHLSIHLVNKKAFTLIELLVVVLIIGILSAVVFPQYQKAVEKARLAEAVTNIASIEKALDLYVLEHGYKEVYFFQPNNTADSIDKLDIELENSLDCSKDQQGCWSQTFAYGAECFAEECAARVTRLPRNPADLSVGEFLTYDSGTYNLSVTRKIGTNQWVHTCFYAWDFAVGKYMCESLKAKGWISRSY